MKYGYFDNEKREYVIEKVDLPTSWTNYLGVRDMCGVVNHTAGGYIFYKTPEYHRITRFRANSVPMDRPGHYVYLRDDETGDYFSWSYVGFYFVIILTGLFDIPEDIYEAAYVDGCSKFKQVFYITIPLLRGVICTCITLAVTGALKVFDLPWVIVPKGAPQGVTHFLGTYMYEQTFTIGNIDYGSTIAFVIVLMGVIVSQITSKIIKPDENL